MNPDMNREVESHYPEALTSLATAVQERGGRLLMVGGAVRDELLGLPPTDFDVEAFGLPVRAVEEVAAQLGAVKEVGRDFGIFKMRIAGHEIDLGLPRRDSKISPGHRGFQANVEPSMTVAEAAQRRDFTIGAIYKDPLTGEVLDPTHGANDLQQRRLRMVDPTTFVEDPLRLLRGAQLAARYELKLDPATLEQMRLMMPEIKTLKPDRLVAEWRKLMVKAERPSIGLEIMKSTDYFKEYFPVIDQLASTPQDPRWHPEGNVWVHTKLVVDQARRLAATQELSAEETLIATLAAFCHDLGKVSTTQIVDRKIITHGHEEAGADPARDWLEKSGFPESIIRKVIPLVTNHLKPALLYESEHRGQWVTGGALRRLAKRVYPSTIKQLALVATADHLGRGPFPQPDGASAWPTYDPASEWLLAESQRRGVDQGRPEPVLYGRDLVERGWSPGPIFGQVIALAEQLAEQGYDRAAILALLDQAEEPAAALATLEQATQPSS